MVESGLDLPDELVRVVCDLGEEVAVAVSGGIDSLTLATLAQRLLGEKVAMFHAISPAVPSEATERVERLAREQNWKLRVFDAGEFADPVYRSNPVNRCFFCKSHLYEAIATLTRAQIVSGANLDDLAEFRPGLEAARERAVRHPYLEARIDKAHVRRLARQLGLGDLAQLPAAPCLSSRIETGLSIRPDVLKAVHAVEKFAAATLAAATVRCRLRAAGIVIELDPESLARLDAGAEARIRAEIERVWPRARPNDVSFAAYRNGSAFLARAH